MVFDSFAVIHRCFSDAGHNVICGFELAPLSEKWVKSFVLCIYIFSNSAHCEIFNVSLFLTVVRLVFTNLSVGQKPILPLVQL